MFVFSSLLEESPGLEAALRSYDRWKFVGQLAGLLTCPECHANTVRLEALVHLAVAISRGETVPSRDNLLSLFEEHFQEVGLALQEDPLEDVFISNVFESTGNHRIFEGVWERNDYWLQVLLRGCQNLPEKQCYALMLRSVGALLDMSDEIAERNGLVRNSASSGEPQEVIYVPEEDSLGALTGYVEFQLNDLNRLGINPVEIEPFIWKDKAPEKLVGSNFQHTPLERRPILHCNGKYMLALPTAVSVACRRFILETVNKEGDLRLLDHCLSLAQGRSAQSTLSRLKGEPWNPGDIPKPPHRGLLSLFIIPFQFDSDKFGFLTVLQPRLDAVLRDGFSYFQDYSSNGATIRKDLEEVADYLASCPGFRHGLLIVAIGGVGAPVAFPLPKLSDKWEFASYSVPNFEMLAGARNADLSMIWRLARQVTRARQSGIRFLNPNGDFNLFANWQQQKYSIIPLEVPTDRPGLLLTPPINALLELRGEIRRSIDSHSVPRRHPDRFVEVERKNAYAWFQALREEPYFVQLGKKELASVVESKGAWWWSVSQQVPRSAREHSIIFQMWDCFGNWLIPVSKELSRIYNPGHAVAEFRITFLNIEDWSDNAGSNPVSEVKPTWSLIQPGVISVVITEDFFRTFMQAENRAERALVSTMLEAGAALLGESILVQELIRLTNVVLPLGSGRYFHLVPGHDATLAAYQGPAEASGLRREVIAEVSQGLGAAIAPERRNQETSDPEQVRTLVRAAVANLKEQISIRLKQYSLQEIVLKCLDVFDCAHRDHHRWKVSSAALLSLHKDHEEIFREAHHRENERSGANIAARTLIETALFSCPIDCGEAPSESAMQELLALSQTLVLIANYDLPKRAGFPSGSVRIAPNGAFQVVNEFLDEIRIDFMKSTFESGYKAMAEKYRQFFSQQTDESLPADLVEFNSALKSEIGWDIFEAFNVGASLNRWGMQERRSVFVIRRSELSQFLVSNAEVDSKSTDQALHSLRIFPRCAWDKELPSGCDHRDVFPWRFKRRFSVLRRPFIEITREDDPLLVVSPLLVREALGNYLVENIYRGEFPPEFFSSDCARRYVDVAVKRRSDAFVKRVAEAMRQAGFEVKTELKMTKLGAPQKLGDIDVFAWRKGPQPVAWALECKALRNARSTEEILDQLDDFRGNTSDKLDRHKKRLEWLCENMHLLVTLTTVPEIQLHGRVITSHQVPMQFLPEADSECLFTDIDCWEDELSQLAQ